MDDTTKDAPFAGSWPARPVHLMVPYLEGGPSDAVARIISGPLGTELGQEVIVENLGGVSGALAAQKVLAEPADGHYLLQASISQVILSPLADASIKLTGDDFRLVHPLVHAVPVLVTRSNLQVSSVDELIELAKRTPDRPLRCGTLGVGSLYNYVLEDLRQRTGVRLQHAPRNGNLPILKDMADGQIDFAVLVFSASMGALAAQGAIKVIGQFGEERSKLLKDVPTVGEGRVLKNFSWRLWIGLLVPRHTPEVAVLPIHAAIGKVLQDPVVRMQLAAQTQDAAAPMSLGEASRFFESETERYRAMAEVIHRARPSLQQHAVR